MKAQRVELVRQLRLRGWDFTQLEEYELDWWADEMWLLESLWSPVGKQAYVTFLIDPQSYEYGGAHRKGRGVWAVLASASKPLDWSHSEYEEGYFTLTLKGWEEGLPDFFGFLDRLRDADEDRGDLGAHENSDR